MNHKLTQIAADIGTSRDQDEHQDVTDAEMDEAIAYVLKNHKDILEKLADS